MFAFTSLAKDKKSLPRACVIWQRVRRETLRSPRSMLDKNFRSTPHTELNSAWVSFFSFLNFRMVAPIRSSMLQSGFTS